MARQFSLIPVSAQECTDAGYLLVKLLDQLDEEDDAFDEAKKAHKETKAVLSQGIAEQRAIIRRRQQEVQEGTLSAQVDAALWHGQEREDGRADERSP